MCSIQFDDDAFLSDLDIDRVFLRSIDIDGDVYFILFLVRRSRDRTTKKIKFVSKIMKIKIKS